ncbi:MAG TPA: hypothetical protein DCE48_13895 [Lachnospiraceae bacterium]|nr:hypothetical protein [Lachnospiraceae bacterium]
MSSEIQKLYDLPDISFIDNITIDTLVSELREDFQEKCYEIEGKNYEIRNFDLFSVLINCIALKLYQGYQTIDKAGKMNLLKYATGNHLQHIGFGRSVEKIQGTAASCYVRFSLESARNEVIVIKEGTRVSPGNDVYYEATEYNEIPVGELYKDILVECQYVGTVGNNYGIGTINTLVDIIPFVTVSNTTIPSNGTDEETDEQYRERIFIAPSGNSTVGTEDSCIYYCKTYDPMISDVKVINSTESIVRIIILKESGEIPQAEYLEELRTFLSLPDKRHVTDKFIVEAPAIVEFEATVTYYIYKNDTDSVDKIKEAVIKANEEYVVWQKSKIGRSVNPSQLVYKLITAGAKYVDVNNFIYTDIDSLSVAYCKINLVFGGVSNE